MVESRSSRVIPQPAPVVFDRITALGNHERLIPMTRITTPPRRPRVGDVTIATTAGILPDTMELVSYEVPMVGQPGLARWVKRGPVLLGEAEIVVTPVAGGCRVEWIERDIRFAGIPARLTTRPTTAAVGLMTRLALWRFARLSARGNS